MKVQLDQEQNKTKRRSTTTTTTTTTSTTTTTVRPTTRRTTLRPTIARTTQSRFRADILHGYADYGGGDDIIMESQKTCGSSPSLSLTSDRLTCQQIL